MADDENDLAAQILELANSGLCTFAVSSEYAPIRLTVEGRVERIRAHGADSGSCNPPWSSWDN